MSENVNLEKLKILTKEALEYRVELPTVWSAEGAHRIYQSIPLLRGYCGRLEEILYEIELSRAKLIHDKRALELVIEQKNDEQVEKTLKQFADWYPSADERASLRRVAIIDERLELVNIRKVLSIVDVFHRAVDRRYTQLLGAKSDLQAMANLLRVGNILGEIE